MVQQAQRLSKSRDDRFLFGVAGGLAEYFDIDPVLVRVGWVLLTVATGGIGLLVYIVMAIVTPDGRRQVSKSAAGEDAVDDLSDSVDEPDPVPALFKKAHRQEHTGHRPHRGRGHHSAQQLGCLRLDTVGHRLACGNSGPGSHNSHSIDPARYLMNAGKTRMRRRGFSLFGLLLVAIGAVLLLNTTSVLPFGIWFELVDFWPVLLVIIGAKIMLAPRWPLVGAGLVALIIVGTVTAASLTLPPYQNRGPLRVTYVEPLADTEILRLSMGFAGGRVELTSDPASISRYPRLLAADFGNRPARVIHYQTGRLTKIYLSTEGAVIEFASGRRLCQGRTRIGFGWTRSQLFSERNSGLASDGLPGRGCRSRDQGRGCGPGPRSERPQSSQTRGWRGRLRHKNPASYGRGTD